MLTCPREQCNGGLQIVWGTYQLDWLVGSGYTNMDQYEVTDRNLECWMHQSAQHTVRPQYHASIINLCTWIPKEEKPICAVMCCFSDWRTDSWSHRSLYSVVTSSSWCCIRLSTVWLSCAVMCFVFQTGGQTAEVTEVCTVWWPLQADAVSDCPLFGRLPVGA